MAESTVIRTKCDGIIVISDSGGANSYTVAYEPGDFSFDAPLWSVTTLRDRCALIAPRRTQQEPLTFSFSVHQRDMGATAAHATLPDICHPYSGGYIESSWASTLGTGSDEFTYDTALTIDGTAFGEADQTLTFPDGSLRGSFTEGDPNTYSVSGTCHGAYRPEHS